MFPALALLSNYINMLETSEELLDCEITENGESDRNEFERYRETKDEEAKRGADMRDKIAKAMWRDYERYKSNRE